MILLGEVMSIVCCVEGSSVFFFVVDGELLVPGVYFLHTQVGALRSHSRDAMLQVRTFVERLQYVNYKDAQL